MESSNRELLDRLENLERRLALYEDGSYKPATFEYERDVPLVQDLKISSASNGSSTSVVLNWIEPQDSQIEGYDIYSKNITDQASSWTKIGEVTQPPFGLNILADSNKTINFGVRTKYRNGLGTSIENMVTAPLAVTEPVASITSPSQVGPNVIGDSAFVRSGGDRIAIQDADIGTLSAGKITAGSLSASVAVLGTVLAQQIIGTTISGVAFQTIGGSNSVTLTGGGFTAAGATYTTFLTGGFLDITASGQHAALNAATLTFDSGTNDISLSSAGNATLTLTTATGSIGLTGSSGTVNISGPYLVSGTTVISASRDITGVDINATGVYKVDGTNVINSSGAFVGAGVDVGANGISCGNYNLNGGHVGVAGPTTFTTVDGKTVTVRGGIITNIA